VSGDALTAMEGRAKRERTVTAVDAVVAVAGHIGGTVAEIRKFPSFA